MHMHNKSRPLDYLLPRLLQHRSLLPFRNLITLSDLLPRETLHRRCFGAAPGGGNARA